MRSIISVTILCLFAPPTVIGERRGEAAGRSGQIDVIVTDLSGAPIQDVLVTLQGLISRDLHTDGYGRVTFTDLPYGRYDVIAWSGAIPVEAPRVIDLLGQPAPLLEIVLKPLVSRNRVIDVCGNYLAPRTLAEFAAEADAVAHVKIEQQRTYREGTMPGSEPEFIWTASDARWLEFFNGSAIVTLSEPIIQFGGRIDLGDDVEYEFGDLAPLNVGDEYVLFLKRYEGDERLQVHRTKEGAFLLRNGRVSPLGSQDLARAWKGASAEKFLQALRSELSPRATR